MERCTYSKWWYTCQKIRGLFICTPIKYKMLMSMVLFAIDMEVPTSPQFAPILLDSMYMSWRMGEWKLLLRKFMQLILCHSCKYFCDSSFMDWWQVFWWINFLHHTFVLKECKILGWKNWRSSLLNFLLQFSFAIYYPKRIPLNPSRRIHFRDNGTVKTLP